MKPLHHVGGTVGGGGVGGGTTGQQNGQQNSVMQQVSAAMMNQQNFNTHAQNGCHPAMMSPQQAMQFQPMTSLITSQQQHPMGALGMPVLQSQSSGVPATHQGMPQSANLQSHHSMVPTQAAMMTPTPHFNHNNNNNNTTGVGAGTGARAGASPRPRSTGNLIDLSSTSNVYHQMASTYASTPKNSAVAPRGGGGGVGGPGGDGKGESLLSGGFSLQLSHAGGTSGSSSTSVQNNYTSRPPLSSLRLLTTHNGNHCSSSSSARPDTFSMDTTVGGVKVYLIEVKQQIVHWT